MDYYNGPVNLWGWTNNWTATQWSINKTVEQVAAGSFAAGDRNEGQNINLGGGIDGQNSFELGNISRPVIIGQVGVGPMLRSFILNCVYKTNEGQ